MNVFTDTKIGTRLALTLVVILIIAALGFLYTSLKTRVIYSQVNDIYNVHFISMQSLIEADRDAYQSSIALIQAMSIEALANQEMFKTKLAEVDENYEQLATRYAKFENECNFLNVPENKENNEIFHKNYEALKNYNAKIIELIKADSIEQAQHIYYGEYLVSFQAMRDAMDKFTGISQDEAEKAFIQSGELSRRILKASFLIICIVLLIIISANISLTRSIANPIRDLVAFLGPLSKGDLTNEISANKLKRKDELGVLYNSMSEMVLKLNDIVTTIKQNSMQIASASDQLSGTSQQLSQGANEQAASVEEVSSTIEQITANINQNSENSIQTEKISEASALGIENVNKSSKESLNSIKVISEKITIINDIAFQTNILALNAAVEAARAGEHGKGFAVVAAEVRKLAERSKIAADEIMNLSSQSVRITEEAGKQMDAILPEIKKTAQLVQEISSASLEQSNGASQVNNAIQQLNNVTQQNASASEELATSAEELASQAYTLNDVISFFKIKGDAGYVSQPGAGRKKAGTSAPKMVEDKKTTGIQINLKKATEDTDFESF